MNTHERVYSLFIMLLGASFYAVTIGSITSIISSFTKAQTQLDYHLRLVDKLCKRYGLSRKHWRKMKKGVTKNSVTKQHLRIDEETELVLDLLPSSLK